jgi:hypothetical protein
VMFHLFLYYSQSIIISCYAALVVYFLTSSNTMELLRKLETSEIETRKLKADNESLKSEIDTIIAYGQLDGVFGLFRFRFHFTTFYVLLFLFTETNT